MTPLLDTPLTLLQEARLLAGLARDVLRCATVGVGADLRLGTGQPGEACPLLVIERDCDDKGCSHFGEEQ